jgi:ribonuclease D
MVSYKKLITTESELKELCDFLSSYDTIAVDTEFVWTKTYYPILGIIQLGVSPEHSFIVDAVAIKDPTALRTLLEDGSITKVFHDAHQDMVIINRYTGGSINSVFDTQLAASFAGLGQSLSLEKLIKELAGVSLSKSETRTDWVKRPLTEKQIEYALDDVRYMVECTLKLKESAEKNGTLNWLLGEMNEKYSSAIPFPFDDAVNRQFKKSANRVGPKLRSKIYSIVKLIETEARKRDIPRDHVIPKEKVPALAKARVREFNDLERLHILSPNGLNRYGNEIVDILTSDKYLPDDLMKNTKKSGGDTPEMISLASILSGVIRSVAGKQDIDLSAITTKNEVTSLAREYIEDGKIPCYDGWRGELLNESLSKFIDGSIYIHYNKNGGGIEVVEPDTKN